MIRIDPVPANCTDPTCKFCPSQRAVAMVTVGRAGSEFRRRWQLCELCLAAWRAELERAKSVA